MYSGLSLPATVIVSIISNMKKISQRLKVNDCKLMTESAQGILSLVFAQMIYPNPRILPRNLLSNRKSLPVTQLTPNPFSRTILKLIQPVFADEYLNDINQQANKQC